MKKESETIRQPKIYNGKKLYFCGGDWKTIKMKLMKKRRHWCRG